MKKIRFYNIKETPDRIKIKSELRRAGINFYREENTSELIRMLSLSKKKQSKNSNIFYKAIKYIGL